MDWSPSNCKQIQEIVKVLICPRLLYCNELLTYICLTARGTARERADLLFRLCDLDRTGEVTLKHLTKVFRSVNELGKETEH